MDSKPNFIYRRLITEQVGRPRNSQYAEKSSDNTAAAQPVVQSPRKILLDCGANVASTVLLFRETYPGGRDFTIHSFEIDDRLSPYFSPYDKHRLHCPVGVAGKDGMLNDNKNSIIFCFSVGQSHLGSYFLLSSAVAQATSSKVTPQTCSPLR